MKKKIKDDGEIPKGRHKNLQEQVHLKGVLHKNLSLDPIAEKHELYNCLNISNSYRKKCS